MWDLVESVVKDEGLFLFDLDLPVGRKGALRVFVTGEDGKGLGITVADCTKISRRLNLLLDVEIDAPGSYVLEVSSPGINRRLRRPEHFKGAVGEHVRINTDAINGKGQAIYGKIISSDEQNVIFCEDKKEENIEISFSTIREARVDFLFDN